VPYQSNDLFLFPFPKNTDEFVDFVESKNPWITQGFHIVILVLTIPNYKLFKFETNFSHYATDVHVKGEEV
jgi:hypothetical protein